MTLACIGDDYLELWVFVEDLFNAAVVAAFFPRDLAASLLLIVVFVIFAQVPWARNKLGRLVGW